MQHDAVESPMHRRGFLGGIAASAAVIAAGGLLTDGASAQGVIQQDATDAWLGQIKGQHKQFFDAVSINDGFSLAYAMNYLDTMGQTYKLGDSALTAVVGLRHFSIPIAFSNAVWAKYKLGEFFKVNDPATKAPATRNPFAYVKEGELMFPGMAVEKMQARGTVITVCNVALNIISGLAAQAAGLPKEPARNDWVAGMFKGVHIVPSGVLAVGRAQERGCTYCFAG
jgi:hypothetical protein